MGITITAENYFSSAAEKLYWSNSQVRNLLSCEAAAVAQMRGDYRPESSEAMTIGTMVDAELAGTGLGAWAETHADLCYTKTGKPRAEYLTAMRMIDRIRADDLCAAMLDGEHQKVLTGKLFTKRFKAKPDVILSADQCAAIVERFPGMGEALAFSDGAIVDLKTTSNLDPVYLDGQGRVNWIEAKAYDRQLGIYQELFRKATGKKLPCFIVAVTREKVPTVALYQIPQIQMDLSLKMLKAQIKHLARIRSGKEAPARCEHCEYCRMSKHCTEPETPDGW